MADKNVEVSPENAGYLSYHPVVMDDHFVLVNIGDLGTRKTSISINHSQLVGGLEHEFYFSHHIGNVIIPADELIFSEG